MLRLKHRHARDAVLPSLEAFELAGTIITAEPEHRGARRLLRIRSQKKAKRKSRHKAEKKPEQQKGDGKEGKGGEKGGLFGGLFRRGRKS